MRVAAAVSLAVATFLATPTSAAAPAQPKAAKARRAAHPDTAGVKDCRGCHAGATKAAFGAWSRGKHGEVLVTCVVCHGSLGSDFTRRPSVDRCRGCHPEEVASLRSPFARGKTCFDCHPGHELDPHGARATATEKTKDVTRTELSGVAFPDQGAQSVPLTIQPSAPAQGAGPAAGAAPTNAPAAARPGGPDPVRNVPSTPAAPPSPAPPPANPQPAR